MLPLALRSGASLTSIESGRAPRPPPCGRSRSRRAAVRSSFVAHAQLALLDLRDLLARRVLDPVVVADRDQLLTHPKRDMMLRRARCRSASRTDPCIPPAVR